MKSVISLGSFAMLLLATVSKLYAVEGALGRPISGAAINPYAGLIPPAPGFGVSVGEAYYEGSIGGGTTVPTGSLLTLGIDTKVSFTPISLLYIWPTTNKRWNFASAISLPVTWLEAEATVTVGPRTGRVKQDTFGLFDLAIVPITASYHISQTDHLAFSLTVWAPTGDYDPDRLANLGLNNWTFIPGIAYTKIFPKAEVELSALWAMQFYTENPDTDYQNGIISDLEATLIKRFKGGAGIGVVGSWIEQITDDEGTTADRLDGFRGQAFGVGPIATYSTKIGKSDLQLNARFIHEFDNRKRIEGDLFQFGASLKF